MKPPVVAAVQLLLRAVRELQLSPSHRAWAEELVQNAVSALPTALSAEEAFGTYQALMQNLQPATWANFLVMIRCLNFVFFGLNLGILWIRCYILRCLYIDFVGSQLLN